MSQDKRKAAPGQGSVQQAVTISQLFYVFVQTILCCLYQGMDRRLVQTCWTYCRRSP